MGSGFSYLVVGKFFIFFQKQRLCLRKTNVRSINAVDMTARSLCVCGSNWDIERSRWPNASMTEACVKRHDVRILVEAPILEDLVAEGLIAEDQVAEDTVAEDPVTEELIPTNLTVLPSDSYVRTWRNGLGGQVFDSLGNALLSLADLKHYSCCQDEDLILKLKWHNIVATQLTYVMEGRLKGVMKEADKEKALKQVAEASLKEKTLGLNVMERRVTTTEKALELAE
nr:hypothetical protein CFP56_61492 [Quercus suber]